MEITISKTVQVRQFEPLTVTITESGEVTDNQSFEQLKEKIGACVADVIATEVERYRAPAEK